MADPVSWFVIERGWEVVDSEGEPIGKVEETIGDSTHDIFDGLSVATSLLGAPRYVPAEQVAEITEGRVRLKVGKDAAERLGEYEEPPTTAQIEAEDASLVERIEQPIEAPIRRKPEHEHVLRRLAIRISTWFRKR
jgi:hypothetical protein